jgi:hypothetical protein
MEIKVISKPQFAIGDLVRVKNISRNERFCIIGFKNRGTVAILKALFNDTYIIEKPLSELQTLLIKGLL